MIGCFVSSTNTNSLSNVLLTPVQIIIIKAILLKCLYLAQKEHSHVYMCAKEIDFACFGATFSIRFSNQFYSLLKRCPDDDLRFLLSKWERYSNNKWTDDEEDTRYCFHNIVFNSILKRIKTSTKYYAYDNFYVTKIKYMMHNFEDNRVLYNNAVRPVIC